METAPLRCAFTTSIVLQKSTNIFPDATPVSPFFASKVLRQMKASSFYLRRTLRHTTLTFLPLSFFFSLESAISLFFFFIDLQRFIDFCQIDDRYESSKWCRFILQILHLPFRYIRITKTLIKTSNPKMEIFFYYFLLEHLEGVGFPDATDWLLLIMWILQRFLLHLQTVCNRVLGGLMKMSTFKRQALPH